LEKEFPEAKPEMQCHGQEQIMTILIF
jgi:hypothetical protein